MRAAAAFALGLALGLAGCTAAPPPPSGAVYLAGSGQWRGINLADLSTRGQVQLPGRLVQALYDRPRHSVLALVSGGNGLYEFDGAGRPRGHRSLEGTPVAMVLARDGSSVWIAITGGVGEPGAVERIGLDRGQVLARAEVGREPSGLALSADGTGLIVANAGGPSATLLAVSEQGLRRQGTIELDAAPRAVVTLPFGHKAFLLCGDRVAVVDMARGGVLTYLVAGPQAQQMLAKPDGGEVFISNASGTISAIDTNTNEISGTLPAGRGAGAMAAAPDSSVLYVANADAGTVSVLSLSDRTQVAVVRVGERPVQLALGPAGRYLLVADAGSNDVAVVRSNLDPQNPNTLLTLLAAPPAPHALVTVP